jgi:hypothetical protein
MDRRSFLRRSSIALAGGLLLGDAALEAFERLTHVRKSFPSAAIIQKWTGKPVYFDMPFQGAYAMIPDGGYECVATTQALSVWSGPGSVDWKQLGLDPKWEKFCLTAGQKEGYANVWQG